MEERIPLPVYRRLLVLRGAAIGAQLAVLAVAHLALALEVPVGASLAVIGAQAASVLLALWWWPAGPVRAGVYAAHLALDLIGLTALFHLNGGYANPFAFSYLMPLALAATVLGRAPVLTLTALAVGGYALVCVWYRPMAHYHGQLGSSFDLHLAGMVAGYVLGTAVIAGFVLPAAQAQRRRARELADIQARAGRDADVVALGALLAGSAHALATPLGSAVLLADALAETGAVSPAGQERLALLRAQLRECQRSLRRALSAAADPGAARVDVAMDTYLRTLSARFLTQRPGVRLRTRWPAGPAPLLDLDDRVDQLLLTVLHNAADAGPAVWLVADWRGGRFQAAVRDRGPGLAALPAPGRARQTTKPDGHGLGLFLAGAVARGLGGEIAIAPARGGGTRVRISLPLRRPGASA